jgi:hypothetical protein
MVPLAGALRLYEAARPHYAAYPERLALMLYDHSHTVTPEQLAAMVNWVAPFFLAGMAAENDAGGNEPDEEQAS